MGAVEVSFGHQHLGKIPTTVLYIGQQASCVLYSANNWMGSKYDCFGAVVGMERSA